MNERPQTKTGDRPADEVIERLAKAVSTQAEVANRIWLGLVTVAIVGLLPKTPSAGFPGDVDLPFSLGHVVEASFHLIVFLMIVVFAIAFSAAHAQQIRAQTLAQDVINTLPNHATGTLGMHPRELFDLLRLPSLNRVAPLAQLLRGRFQFYRSHASCPAWLRIVTTLYYISLKLTSMVVFFGLPAFSLYHSYKLTQVAGYLWWLMIVGGLLAASTLFLMCFAELVYLMRSVPSIWSGGDSGVKTDEAVAPTGNE
jgi:hypothetical protein